MSHLDSIRFTGTQSIRIGTAIAALAVASLLAPSAVWAQTRELTSEVEIRNDFGESLGVTIENHEPIEVIERPPNASYVLYSSGFMFLGNNDSAHRQVTVPAGSHMRGVTVSMRTDGPVDRCEFSLTYPTDPSQRPALMNTHFITTAQFSDSAGTQHIPLYDLYVGEDVELNFRYRAEGDRGGRCWMTVGLHMRPLPGGVSGGVGGFGF